MKYLLTLCIIVVLTVIQQCIAQAPVITLSHTTNETYDLVPPKINRASIKVLSQDVTLQTNIPGKWQDPNDVNTTDNMLTIAVFTVNHAGLYSFYAINGSEVLSIIISAIGSNFAELTSPDQYVPLLCNYVFYTETTLVCATNDTSQQIQWSYKSMQNAIEINIQDSSTWDVLTGISTLQIMTSQQGYYSCRVGSVIYRAGIFDPMSTIVATTGITGYYIRGIDPVGIQLLCDLEDTSIDLNTITWRSTATNSSYSNPVVINSLDLTGSRELNCYVGATTTFSVQLTIHDPILTLNYTGINAIDYNTLSPNNTSIAIPLYSTNVYLSANIATGTWSPPPPPLYDIPGAIISINLFTLISPGKYSFKTQESWNGEEKEVFSVDLTPTGTPLAITDTNDQYIPQPVNSFFYAKTELVCTTEEDTLVIWGHQLDLNQNIEDGTATTSDGIGELMIDFPKEGYYSCEITMDKVTSLQYAGLFNAETTATATTSGDIFNYTDGTDNGIGDSAIRLLCNPMDPTINISDVKWQIAGVSHLNPVKINTIIPPQLPAIMNIACYVKDLSDIRIQSTLYIQGSPNLTLSYDGAVPKYFSKQPVDENIILIPTFATNVRIENNLLFGKWDSVLGGSERGTDLEIPLMSLQHNGDANFVVNKWQLNDEVIVIKISVSTQGTNFGMLDNQGQIQAILNGTTMQISDNISVLCATDKSNSNIEWRYNIVDSDSVASKTPNSVFSATTGFSILEISAEEPGMYTCVIDESISYSILTIDTASSIITDFNNTIDFVAGASSVIYYDNTDLTVLDSSIRWTTEEVQNADTRIYSPEFENPVSLNSIFNAVGTGSKELYCFYRMSPAKLLGSIALNIRDSVIVTITYGNTTISFDDASNSMYPNAQTLEVPVLTPDIQFDCNLASCLWEIDLVNARKNELAAKPYTIDLLRIEDAGVFGLKRISSNDDAYTTAHFKLVVTGAFEQRINAIYPQKIDDTTLMISWDLISEQTDISNEEFEISYGIDNTNEFTGKTQELSFRLTGLTSNQTYTILVQLSYAFTNEITSKEIMFYLEGTYIPTEPPSEAESTITIPIVIAVVVILIMILGILIILLIILIFLNTRKPRQFVKSNMPMEDPDIVNIEKSKGNQYTNPTFDPNAHAIPSSDPSNMPTEIISTIVPLKGANENVTFYSNPVNPEDENPYMEPIELEYFKHHLDTVWSQRNALEAEYRSLGGTGQRYPWTAAKLDGNGPKNKFIDTLPYDKSRVILMQEGDSIISNYINASYIPGLYVHHTFIAAQGPKTATVEDFWRMIVEHEVDNIVMVTNLYEAGSMKCERYFPTVHYTDETFGRYRVQYGDEDVYASYVIRQMAITDGTFTRQIRQFHFTAWPDHDVPTTFKHVLDFVKIVKSSMLSFDKPILVHCSAGVGRTGTFITLFNLIEAIYDQQPISIYRIVNEMREHRPQMVQTFRQYKFIYLAVLELLYEDTAIVVEEFPREYQRYLQSDREGSVSILFDQFYELEYQCGKMTPPECFVASDQINVSKNPIKNALPNDNNRVVLSSEDLPIDYINASYLDAFRYIITIHPLEDTVLDFLQMLYQTEASLVIMLATPDEYADMINRKSDRIPYWPNMPEYIDVMPFRTEVVETEEKGGITRNIIKLTNWSDNRMHTFTQLISTSWEDDDEVADIDEIIDIMDIMRQEVGYVKHRPIVIHCKDGIGKSGVLYTVYKCIQNLLTSNEVDIFQLVKQLRGERMNFVPSLVNYTSCHSLLNGYFSLNGLYQDSL